MKKNSRLLSVILLLLVFKSYAQDGYTINIDIKNEKNAVLQLSYYRGNTTKPDLVDSAVIDKSHIVFKNAKKIIGGIYRLDFKDGSKTNAIDIAVDNSAKLHFSLQDTSLLKLIADDKINQTFFKYQVMNPGSGAAETRLLLNLINKNYPQSVAALYAKLELKKMDAYLKKQDTANRKFRDEYFSNIDVQDKRLQLLPNTYSYLNSYFNLLPVNNKNYQDAVNLLLKNSDCKSKNYIFYLTWVFKNIAYLHNYNLSNAFRYVYETYVDKEPCKTDNPIFYAKTTASFKELDGLVTGNSIPDFEMQDSLGTVYDIKSLAAKTKYTFLVFFDPDCSHCQEILPQASRYFDSAHFDKNLIQLVTFANAVDLKDWQKFLTESKLQNWLNVKPKNGDQTYLLNLKVYTNPNFFLLDDKGEILLKKFDRGSITAILAGKSK